MHASIAFECLRRVPGLRPVMPQGAMYMMVGLDMASFPAFDTDLQLVNQLVCEESVFVLPGQCFDFPGYVRLVLTVPEEQLREACDRIAAFCARHHHHHHHHHAVDVDDAEHAVGVVVAAPEDAGHMDVDVFQESMSVVAQPCVQQL
ncbi:hypothetical protein ONE63_002912 [Megalurothrips usitatus]|uniref:Aminotransferase class I/classII large domain-containing protein n=1 Tax=Megalurothrips usitatus TaxID=439358 RepID=A0AAV7XCA6_9NEOP|nr:hypothetical protein ONE63_002912 [Megalurothrips usitatus]